jgi:glycosyltransferase involved in cell wall biosynthesis
MTACSSPLVSVCVAAYNAEGFISDAINSILKQTYNNLEVLVLDDCSTDNTLAVVNETSKFDCRLKVYSNEQNLGYLKTFNKLLEMSTGEFICFVDADDWIDLEKITKQIRYFEEHPNIGIVGTFVNRTDVNGRKVGTEEYPVNNDAIVSYLTTQDDVCMCGSSVMITKSVKYLIGGYREFFDGCPAEDYDWIRRISEKYQCANLDEHLYNYRFADNSLTRKVHYSVKARHAAVIAGFLATQRFECGLDSLQNPCNDGLDKFLCKLENKSRADISSLYRSTSIQHAINGDVRSAMSDFKRCLDEKLSFIALVKLFSIILIIVIVPNDILLRAKNFFKLKSVSKST